MAGSQGKQTRFEMVIGAVDRFSGTFKGFNDKVATATAGMNRLQKAAAGLSRATGLTRLKAATQNVSNNMKNMVREGMALAGKFSLIAGGAAVGLTALARSAANAGVAASDAASRAGVGLRTWQEYAHAATLSGVGNEQLEKSLRGLQDTAIKAFKGDQSQASLLKLAGINPRTAKGEVKNASSVMMELADKVKALRDTGQEAKATNLVKSILGEGGTKLMPMLRDGSEGLKKMRMEAHSLGLVFSEEDAEASGAFNTSLARLGAMVKGIGFTVGKVLLPPVTKLIDKFSAWAGGQREVIGTGFAKWVDSINIDELWKDIEWGLNTLKALGKNIDDVVQRFGGWKTVAIAVAAFMSGNFVWSIFKTVKAFGSLGFAVLTNPLLVKGAFLLGNSTLAFGKFAFLLGGKVVTALASAAAGFVKFGLALMTTPVGWIIAGIAAIAGAAYLIYKNWEPISAFFSGLWGGISQKFTDVWAGVMGKWDSIVKAFKEKLTALTEWLPDWVKEKMGISVGVSGSAAPLNLAPAVSSISESRSEHVEKEKIELVVRAEDGASINTTRSGGGAGSNLSMQNGRLALGD